MKIGILTFHNAYNYGAVLQAYATQEFVRSLGHEVEVIDYHNKNVDWHYDMRKFRIRGFLRSTYRFPLYLIEKYFFWQRRKAYHRFFNEHMYLSKESYSEGENISLLGYDAILIGSDQLWNKRLTKGLDKVYWGQFKALPNTRVAAWSVCMNNIDLTEEDKSQIKEFLKNFTAISVREKSLQSFLQDLTDQTIWHTLDPTLILPSSQWVDLCHPVKESNYIAVYAVRKEKETVAFARKLAKQQGKKLIIIRSYCRWYLSAENKEYCGPAEFLSYIKNADYVVTSSFHGTVFSLLFQRQFVCPRLDGNVRIEDLLSTAGLSNRMVDNWRETCSLPPIDYNRLSVGFEIKKTETMNFLKNVFDIESSRKSS